MNNDAAKFLGGVAEQEQGFVGDQVGRCFDFRPIEERRKAVVDSHIARGKSFEQGFEIVAGHRARRVGTTDVVVVGRFDRSAHFRDDLVEPFDDGGAVIGAIDEQLGQLTVLDMRRDIAIETLGLDRPDPHLRQYSCVILNRHRTSFRFENLVGCANDRIQNAPVRVINILPASEFPRI
ncbi:hypothetical protein WJT74_07080 [Sphingomicrobium sp. XHP0239]|uniref:hypothetical protein n=1 Tax=Sphingomicrobium maritimum TaxID=3133972 RepID=UPI0031CC4E4D